VKRGEGPIVLAPAPVLDKRSFFIVDDEAVKSMTAQVIRYRVERAVYYLKNNIEGAEKYFLDAGVVAGDEDDVGWQSDGDTESDHQADAEEDQALDEEKVAPKQSKSRRTKKRQAAQALENAKRKLRARFRTVIDLTDEDLLVSTLEETTWPSSPQVLEETCSACDQKFKEDQLRISCSRCKSQVHLYSGCLSIVADRLLFGECCECKSTPDDRSGLRCRTCKLWTCKSCTEKQIRDLKQ
jgi:F0F1-type ATP synthase epsilon subunit